MATLDGLTPCQSTLLMVVRQMTKRVVLLSQHPTPSLKRLVYEDEMRDYLVVMDTNSIIGWTIMIRLGSLTACLITPLPGWPY